MTEYVDNLIYGCQNDVESLFYLLAYLSKKGPSNLWDQLEEHTPTQKIEYERIQKETASFEYLFTDFPQSFRTAWDHISQARYGVIPLNYDLIRLAFINAASE